MNTQELEVIATILEDTLTAIADDERVKAAGMLRDAAREIAALEAALCNLVSPLHAGGQPTVHKNKLWVCIYCNQMSSTLFPSHTADCPIVTARALLTAPTASDDE
ncbi:MAG: hypothetical protein ACYTEQ_22690 [Planctomycetota bacterium]|jgi:hypothetical protein